jgi:hypothetical protein
MDFALTQKQIEQLLEVSKYNQMNSEELAWKIKRHGLEMTHISRGSHIGAILSVSDIIAVLYTDILDVDPRKPKKENRDRLILSKGHAGAAIYAALAERGFFSTDELATHYVMVVVCLAMYRIKVCRSGIFYRFIGAWTSGSCRNGIGCKNGA